MREIASVHLSSAVSEPWRLAVFYGLVIARENDGHHVTLDLRRDGMEKIHSLVAFVDDDATKGRKRV